MEHRFEMTESGGLNVMEVVPTGTVDHDDVPIYTTTLITTIPASFLGDLRRVLLKTSPPWEEKVCHSWLWNHATRELELSRLSPGRSHHAEHEVHAIVTYPDSERLLATLEGQYGESRATAAAKRQLADEQRAHAETRAELTQRCLDRMAERDAEIKEWHDKFHAEESAHLATIKTLEEVRAERDRMFQDNRTLRRGVQAAGGVVSETEPTGRVAVHIPPWAERNADERSYQVVTNPDGTQSLAPREPHVCHDENGEAITSIKERMFEAMARADTYREAYLALLSASGDASGLEPVIAAMERLAMSCADRIERGATAALNYTRERLTAADAEIHRLRTDRQTDSATIARLSDERHKANDTASEAIKLAEHRHAEIIREANLVRERDEAIRELHGRIEQLAAAVDEQKARAAQLADALKGSDENRHEMLNVLHVVYDEMTNAMSALGVTVETNPPGGKPTPTLVARNVRMGAEGLATALQEKSKAYEDACELLATTELLRANAANNRAALIEWLVRMADSLDVAVVRDDKGDVAGVDLLCQQVAMALVKIVNEHKRWRPVREACEAYYDDPRRVRASGDYTSSGKRDREDCQRVVLDAIVDMLSADDAEREREEV